MSAYMVSNGNLSKIAGYLAKVLTAQKQNGSCSGADAFYMEEDCIRVFENMKGVYSSKKRVFEAKKLHRALYEMNRQAIVARYGSCEKPYEKYDDTGIDTREETREEWQCRLFGVLRNYLYQCAEGGIPNTDLYKALMIFSVTLAGTIAIDTAKRDWGCGWGEWEPTFKGEKGSKMGFTYPVAV